MVLSSPILFQKDENYFSQPLEWGCSYIDNKLKRNGADYEQIKKK